MTSDVGGSFQWVSTHDLWMFSITSRIGIIRTGSLEEILVGPSFLIINTGTSHVPVTTNYSWVGQPAFCREIPTFNPKRSNSCFGWIKVTVGSVWNDFRRICTCVSYRIMDLLYRLFRDSGKQTFARGSPPWISGRFPLFLLLKLDLRMRRSGSTGSIIRLSKIFCEHQNLF